MTNILLLASALAAGAGTLIYEGRVYPRDAAASTPLYTYERRVSLHDDGLEAAHVTRDAGGAVVVTEVARVGAHYALRRFEADNRQRGLRGSVEVSADGRELRYTLQRDDGRINRARERIDAPAVSGPSLHGLILAHRDALDAGRALPVRMVVLHQATSYGFTIRRGAQAGGRTAFTVTPTSWLLRLALAPLSVTFDDATGRVLRYDGRVPPLRVVDGRWREFDARVEYSARAPAYR